MSKINIYFIIISLFFNIISPDEILKGVYLVSPVNNIDTFIKDNPIISRFFPERFISLRILRHYFFNIRPVNSNLYMIKYLKPKKRLLFDYIDNMKIFFKNKDKNINKLYWNIIKIKDNEYLIQDNQTKNFLESNYFRFKCSNNKPINISKTNYEDIPSKYLFKLAKVYEEAEIKPEHINYINKEPVDVVIKYIDLSDKTLNRTGIIKSLKMKIMKN